MLNDTENNILELEQKIETQKNKYESRIHELESKLNANNNDSNDNNDISDNDIPNGYNDDDIKDAEQRDSHLPIKILPLNDDDWDAMGI
mmetsp:Transcript_94771/g.116071  ORF Transcript_94771/g.116071 Transcript_94771/m.116071 type:complete len:89 (-) Transcript_94771:94-360(-)